MDHTMPNSTTNHIDMRKDWIFIFRQKKTK